MSQTKHKCLLLNSDYTPITIVDWQKAIIWSLRSYNDQRKYGIEILDFHKEQYVTGTGGRKYKIPSVARTIKFFNYYNKPIHFSRRNLFLRDDHTCQYCKNHFHPNQLTYDHVIPKSRYKASLQKKCTNWTNIVTSCIKCNFKKGNRTPEEAGMTLATMPCEPKYSDKYLPWHNEALKIYQTQELETWKPFINFK